MNDGFGGILKACVVRRFARLCAQIAITGGLLTAGAASAEPALSFVRDTPYCYVSTTGRVSTTAFTVELWFKQTSFDSENQLFTQDNNGGTGRIFLYTRNGKPYFQVSGNGLTGNTNLTASTWYHFACVRDASGYGTVYIDGQAVTVPTYLNTDAAPSVTVTIGLLLRSKSGFRGDISDVRIWNTARSQTEIREAMRQRLTGIETGLAHYWPFGEGGGSTVYDRSGKADGTISGATWGYSADLPLSDPSGSWLSSSGGDWSDTANWLSGTPAQGVNVAAFFTNAPPTTITVNNDLTALTLHKLTVSGTNGITFTGNALTFTNLFLASQIATTCGSHRIALPIQTSGQKLFIETATPGALTFSGVIDGSGSVAVNPANSNGGSVAFTGANTYSGFTAVGCGTLSVATLDDGGAASAIGASSADPANLVIGPGTLHYTGASAVTDRGFTVNAGSRKAAVLRLDNDLTLIGPITNITGALIKTGPGTFTYAAPVASLIGRQQSAGITTQVPYPANGDSPANGFGCFTVAGGKVVLGADPAQTNLFSEEVTVGAYTTDQPGQEVSAELEIVGGYARFNTYFDIGYYNGNTVTAPTPLRPAVTVSGGLIDAAGLIMAFGYQTNQNTHAILNIAGGTLTVTGDFRFGDQTGSGMQATINVTSGALIHTSATVGLGSNRGGNNTLNLYGGLIDEYADLKMGANGSTSRVNLNGGILRVRTVTGSTGHEYLTFNGGILQPRIPGQTMADDLLSAVVSTNGAVIDTSLAAYTIAQKLAHDPVLGISVDGGLVKLGSNTLSLTSTGNTFDGPVAVNSGLLRARLGGTNALSVTADATFDALGERCTVDDLTGEGLLTNGVIAVTGTLDAGTNNAPAGAAMAVQNLSLAGGSTLACDWTTNALGQVTNDFVAVSNILASEGPGFLDLGRTETNAITVPFSATIMSYRTFQGTFTGWKAVNTGLPENKAFATVVTAADGFVTLEIRYGGTIILTH